MKKLWKNNRVVFVLVIILIICFISIIGVTLTFFYSKDTSTYGNRLDNIEKYPVSNEFKASYKDKMLENENIKSINFDENIDLEKAKSIISSSLSEFNEEILSYYDIQFILQSDNFTIMASKNVASEIISWNNNTPIEEEEENEEEK